MKKQQSVFGIACWLMAVVLCAGWVTAAGAIEGLDVVLSEKDAADLFGNQKAKLLIKGEKGIYQIDFSKKPWKAEWVVVPKLDKRIRIRGSRVAAETSYGVPLISPDGTRFVYRDDGKITIARFEPGAPEKTVIVENGLHPRWWVHPETGDEYITYLNRLQHDRKSKETPRTMILKIKKGSCKADGEAKVLIEGHAMNGGRSPDGAYMVGSRAKTAVIELKPLATESALLKVTKYGHVRNGFCSVSQNPKDPLAILRDGRSRIWYRPFDAFHKHQLVNPEGFGAHSSFPEWSTHGDVATARMSNTAENALFAYRFSWMNWKRLVNLRNGSEFGVVNSHLWIEKGELPKRPAMELGKWEKYLYERMLTYAPKKAKNGKKTKGKGFMMLLPSKGFAAGGLSRIHEAGEGGTFYLRTAYDVYPFHFGDFTPQDLLGVAEALKKYDDAKSQAAVAYFTGLCVRIAEREADLRAEAYLKLAGSRAEQVKKDLAAAKVTYDGQRVLVGKRKKLGEVVITRAQVARLFGGVKAKYVYLDTEKLSHLTLIDFSKKEFEPERLFTITRHRDISCEPFVSRDGSRATYLDDKKVCVSELKAGAPGKTVLAKEGHFDPRWWYHPKTGEEYIIYVNTGIGHDSNISGITFIQKMKKGTCQPDGPVKKLLEKYAFRGGRSLDGKYICTALPGHALAELKPDAMEKAFVKMLFSSGRMCNPSISQDPERMMWWLWEDRGHATARYFVSPKQTGETIFIPKGANQIQALEWATHPDFFTAYVYGGFGGDGRHGNIRVRNVIYQWSTDKWTTVLDRIAKSRDTRGHLWIDPKGTPVYPPKSMQEKTIEAWDVRLLAAAKPAAEAARKSRKSIKFRIDSLRPHTSWLLGVNEKGQLKIRIGHANTHIRPSGLTLLDKRSLAAALARSTDPEAQALAAFYTLAQKAYGKKESELRVQGLLALAGEEGKSILKEIKAADIQAPQLASLPGGRR